MHADEWIGGCATALQDWCRDNLGDVTFREAFERSRRNINIVVTHPANKCPALLNHITGGHVLVAPCDSASSSRPEGADVVEAPSPRSFQPMNVNYGLFPDIETGVLTGPDGKRLKGADRGRAKKRLMSLRALQDIDVWLKGQMAPAAVSG